MKQIHVAAAVIRENGRIFATARGYGEWKGWWEFPGGKLEPGETAEEALQREIREELNTEIQVGDRIYTVEYDYPTFHLTMDCFWCKRVTGDLELLEAEAARWLAKEELSSVNWLPADLTLIEEIRAKWLDPVLELRQIQPDEARRAAEVEAICFPPSEACKPEIMAQRVALFPEDFIVAIDTEEDRMIGFINGLATDEETLRDEIFLDAGLADPKGKNIMIMGVDVLPQYRLQGVARRMMAAYLKQEKALGREKAVLTCVVEKIPMYEKFGFIDQGESQSEWGGELWHEMTQEL